MSPCTVSYVPLKTEPNSLLHLSRQFALVYVIDINIITKTNRGTAKSLAHIQEIIVICIIPTSFRIISTDIVSILFDPRKRMLHKVFRLFHQPFVK